MSALLDDIITFAVNGKLPLPDILRKCLILGHELKNERLKVWAKQELNGYDDATPVPDYRVLPAQAKGHFIGPLYVQFPSHLIPPLAMQERHRVWATKVYLRQALSAYEEVKKDPNGVLQFPWPSDMVAYYQDKLMQGGFICHSAWQEVSPNAILEMLDTVRNRTLDMALAIKDELGTSYDNLRKIETSSVEKIRSIIFQNTGGITNVALERASIDASGQTQINAGDRRALDEVLKKAGLDAADLQKLTEAIEADGGKQPGTKVQGWIKATGSKVVAGGIKVGVSIGQQLLSAWLLQHYGLKI
jgi:hypothetical protein